MPSVNDVIDCDVTLMTSSACVDDVSVDIADCAVVFDDVIESRVDVTVVCVPTAADETVSAVERSKNDNDTRCIFQIVCLSAFYFFRQAVYYVNSKLDRR